MKLKILFAGLFILTVFAFSVAAVSRSSSESDYFRKSTMLVIRDIGHKILLHSGDPSSRVLPVKQINDDTFQLEFQSSFSFMPDSLVKIVQHDLAQHDLSKDYMVNVIDCGSKEIVYGFQISPIRNNIVPCKGRIQPTRCYTIQITFHDFNPAGKASSGLYLYLVAAIGLSVVAFIGGSYVKKRGKVYEPTDSNFIQLGKYAFHSENRFLKSGSENIDLSDKEAKLLSILATQPNQLIARDHLLKEVWENDGVFTGRSLDMFISKLRKKLKGDSSLQIINVHGKGYKLEIRSNEMMS